MEPHLHNALHRVKFRESKLWSTNCDNAWHHRTSVELMTTGMKGHFLRKFSVLKGWSWGKKKNLHHGRQHSTPNVICCSTKTDLLVGKHKVLVVVEEIEIRLMVSLSGNYTTIAKILLRHTWWLFPKTTAEILIQSTHEKNDFYDCFEAAYAKNSRYVPTNLVPRCCIIISV